MQYVHSSLTRLFLDQSARNFGSIPKIKFSDRLIFYFFHYEEALMSLRPPWQHSQDSYQLFDFAVFKHLKLSLATMGGLFRANEGTLRQDDRSTPTISKVLILQSSALQGCINCGILLSGIQARGVSSEHMENMEMFSCSPT